MAKLRRNHGSSSSRFGASLTRITLIGVSLVLLLFILLRFGGSISTLASENQPVEVDRAAARIFIPNGPSDQIVHHKFFSLGYDNAWEQARWVAYLLTPEQVRNRKVKRGNDFRPDAKIRAKSADREDYRNSGYSRGHLVPAGDMAFDEVAMSETFLYSNMSPQLVEHNGAVWRELEESTRDWVIKHGPTYIVTGPVVGDQPKVIGSNKVAVPEAFFKVLLTKTGKGVGFFIPHEVQTKPLSAFAKTIDEIEALTGLDFFPEQPELASELVEATVVKTDWPINERRFKKRIQSWNKQR